MAVIESIFQIIRTHRWHFFAWNPTTANCSPENNFDNTPNQRVNLRFQDFTKKLDLSFSLLVGKLFMFSSEIFNCFKFKEKSAAKANSTGQQAALHSASSALTSLHLNWDWLSLIGQRAPFITQQQLTLNKTVQNKKSKVDFLEFFPQTQCREKLLKWRWNKKFCHHKIKVQ